MYLNEPITYLQFIIKYLKLMIVLNAISTCNLGGGGPGATIILNKLKKLGYI